MDCKICHAQGCKDLIYPQGIFKCQTGCGCTFRAHKVDIDRYLKTNYWYTGDEELKLYQRSKMAWFEDYILNGDSIEFGAADGDFTYLIRKAVGNRYNVIYSEIVDLLRPEYMYSGIDKYIGPIEAYTQPIKFDNIFLLNVIEHLNDIRGVFGHIYKMLNTMGRFFISTNNGDSFDAHNALFYHWEHTCILTKQAIQILANDFGFRILRFFTSSEDCVYIILEK